LELRQDCIYVERSERSWNVSCGKVKGQIHQSARDNLRIRTL